MEQEDSVLFATYFPSLSNIHLEGLFFISLHDHSKDSSFQQNNPHLLQGTTSFFCELTGPFLSMALQQKSNLGKHPLFNNYNFFIPFYSTVKKSETSLEFVPNRYFLTLSFEITFKNHNECQEWLHSIRFTRNLLKNMSESAFQTDSLSLPAIIIEKTDERIIETKVEMEIKDKTISLFSPEKEYTLPEQIPVNSRMIISLCSFPEERLGDNTFCSMTFFELPYWSNKYLGFLTKDFLYVTFSFLALLTVHHYENIKKKVSLGNLAQKIPNKKDHKLIDNSNIKFISTPSNLICNVYEPFESMNDKLFKTFPCVPKKASTELELLSFDYPIKRRILIIKNPKQVISKKFSQPKQFNASVAFNDQIIKIQSFFSEGSQQYRLKNKQVETFHEISEIDQQLIGISSNQSIDSYSITQISKKVKDICDICGLSQYSLYSHSPGNKLMIEISKLISNLPKENFKTSNSDFINICVLAASAFFFNVDDENKLYLCIKDLLSSVRSKIIEMLPKLDTPFKSIVVFISRLLFKKKFTEFINIIINNHEWRNKNFTSETMIKEQAFLELFRCTLIPFQDIYFHGSLPLEQIPEKPIHLESKDTEIRSWVNLFIQLFPKSNNISDLYYIYVKITKLLIEFFNNGFKCKKSCIFPETRNGWYNFLVASQLNIELTELYVFRKSVNDVVKNFNGNPNQMMGKVIFTGIKCGMIYSWIIFLYKAASENDYYKKDSDILNQSKVVNISDALYLISSLIIELQEDKFIQMLDI